MAPALRISGKRGDCLIPISELPALVRQLHQLPTDAYPQAGMVATWLDAAAADESRVTDSFKPGELEALKAALDHMRFEEPLPPGLDCLWGQLEAELSPPP